ncbi:oxidoreductase-like protein [Chaetomium strumarium]|uniref:Oxidoreductase-like protein n=1 Tax=Chaetomium strumarium TaxID=1170767 RepID=A0AAJ0GNE4_9PEZI|nr:oxidoreductase-like protein [Chaetomium strumarium]
MRRTFLSARPSRAVYRAFGSQQSRRTFATVPTKDDSPPSPIEPSKEQAHPVGPFYEAILRTPWPKAKPDEPSVASQPTASQPPKQAPEEQSSKPADEEKATEETESAAEEKAGRATARRPRKPRQPSAGKDETTNNSKAKSVPLSCSSKEEEGSSNDVQARARIIFGSRLVGPAERAERLAAIRTQSRLIAGVLVPPKPEEPDNCCMSGCVNCVWDRYRDEMEEWAERNAEAERKMMAMDAGDVVGTTEQSMECNGNEGEYGTHDEEVDRGAVTMEDDGGGSVGNWETRPTTAKGGRSVKDLWDEELYKNVPVGIREFMKQEKRLKEKHLREGTVGG